MQDQIVKEKKKTFLLKIFERALTPLIPVWHLALVLSEWYNFGESPPTKFEWFFLHSIHTTTRKMSMQRDSTLKKPFFYLENYWLTILYSIVREINKGREK